MGSGFKDWTAGDVLTASDLDGYLMRQTVMTFASSSARDTALSGVLDEGMVAYLEDTNSLTYYTGSAWKTIFSDWTSFTPAFSNLTEGNGVADCEYRYIAGDIRMRGTFTFGSTTSISGAVGITIANSETSKSSGGMSVGATSYLDSGTAIWSGVCTAGNSVTEVAFLQTNTNNTVTASAPFTWTTNDQIRFDITVAL